MAIFEQHTCWLQHRIVRVDVIGFQKKPDPPAALPSDRRALLVTGCTREQNLGLAGTGRYFGPTLVIPKVGIFSALETDT